MLCYSDLNKSCKIMKKLNGIVHSVYTNSDNNLGKIETDSIEVMLDGIVDDPHRGYTRETWVGDKQPQGTVRRNERQWSAVSIEEINKIISKARKLNAKIITTEKDFVKISDIYKKDIDFLKVKINFTEEEKLKKFLKYKLNEIS